jgi:phosphomannomutase/phosphoglucomutase
MFKDKIFREYDIRGVYNVDYDKDFAKELAFALSVFIRKKLNKLNQKLTISIGQDARLSGTEIAPIFKEAFLSSGFDVYDLQIVPTPLVYFSSFHLKTDASVSITGSHNPPEYNGFKISVETSTLHGSDIQEIKKILKNKEYEPILKNLSNLKGELKKIDIIEPYINDVKNRVKINKKLKVVLDAGNGTAGVVAPKLIRSLGFDVVELYCDLDGTFPNHHPDPTELHNLKDIQNRVLKEKADLGIAYDGDADRIGVVDENAKPIYGDELMVLFSREILKRKPGAKILSEVKCSTRLYEDIKKNGGIGIMWKTGHSLIKAKMKEEKAELAGEMSGHIFFQDRYYGYDDAIYASVRLLEILSNSNQTISQMLSDLPKVVNTPEIRVDCPDEIKFEVVKKVKEKLSQNYTIIDIDGVRIETKDGWALLRASNTQPVIVMRFEAFDENKLKELRQIIENAFNESKKELNS